jgi:hypothetical protein
VRKTALQARDDHALDLPVGLGDVVLLALELDLDRPGEKLARQLTRFARDRDQRRFPGVQVGYHVAVIP